MAESHCIQEATHKNGLDLLPAYMYSKNIDAHDLCVVDLPWKVKYRKKNKKQFYDLNSTKRSQFEELCVLSYLVGEFVCKRWHFYCYCS